MKRLHVPYAVPERGRWPTIDKCIMLALIVWYHTKWIGPAVYFCVGWTNGCEQIGISAKDLIAGCNYKLPVLPDSLISKGVAYELNNFRSMTTHGIVYMTGWRSSVMFHHYHYQASNLHCQGWTKSDLNFLVTNIMNKSKWSLRSLFSLREKLSISSNLQIALLNSPVDKTRFHLNKQEKTFCGCSM